MDRMVALLKKWFGNTTPPSVDDTYVALVARARNPFFYTQMQVPDTLDGRFEMIVLHLFLLQHRLLQETNNTAATEFARQLSEAFFDDMDRSVRELGVADTGVSKRIKRMGKAYHGALQSYAAGLNDPVALRAALARNLYGTIEKGDVVVLDAMAEFIHAELASLAAVPVDTLLSGAYAWGEPAARR